MTSSNPGKPSETAIGLAIEADLPRIEAIITAAYSKYIERLNTLPAAMKTDYRKTIQAGNLYVLRRSDSVIGLICLLDTGDTFRISNLAVAPEHQGQGFGRLLMDYGEKVAIDKGYPEVTLFANEKMFENLVLYTKLGYVEFDRRLEEGFHRVYFRKVFGRGEES
jgi:ribosomal protein S18 acetylase RimI-like enzyme